MPHIEIRDVSLVYDTPAGRVAGVQSASFNIEQSEFLCIVGPSGCGKSTLLNIIAGFLAPTGVRAAETADAAPTLLRPALNDSHGWERLRRFAEVSTYPTITAATAALGLKQGPLTTQIHRLERDLGSQLLQRAERGRPMRLTALGTQVVAAYNGLGRDRTASVPADSQRDGFAHPGVECPRLAPNEQEQQPGQHGSLDSDTPPDAVNVADPGRRTGLVASAHGWSGCRGVRHRRWTGGYVPSRRPYRPDTVAVGRMAGVLCRRRRRRGDRGRAGVGRSGRCARFHGYLLHDQARLHYPGHPALAVGP